MSSTNDENELKQCLEDIIEIVEETLVEEPSDFNQSNQYYEKSQLMDKMTLRINNKLKMILIKLSDIYREYFLDIFNGYHYNLEKGEFSESFKNYILQQFLYDLRAIRDSFDAFQAAFNGNLSIVKHFISTYPNYKDKSGLWGTTLLYSSARNNYIHIVKYLIEQGKCFVNAQNRKINPKSLNNFQISPTAGSTALHAACYNGHLNIVKYLIENGGDYFIKNDAQETPIHNGQLRENIQLFFEDFLIFSYTRTTNNPPQSNILEEENNQHIIDCIWEYKSINYDQWNQFSSDQSDQLHKTLIFKQNQNYNQDFTFKIENSLYQTSIIQFLSKNISNSANKDHLWIRCRGSSILNFDCYSIWQIMFEKHPSNISNKSSTLEIFSIPDDQKTQIKIELNIWYNSNDYINQQLDNAMNSRRKYIHIHLHFIDDQLFEFNLKTFTFYNNDKTIQGYLRWIPTFILEDDKTIIDNFQILTTNSNIIPLTRKHSSKNKISNYSNNNQIEQATTTSMFNISNQNQQSETLDNGDEHVPMVVRFGNLIEETCDVIVVCWSSEYLLGIIYESGGSLVRTAINNQIQKKSKNSITSVQSDGNIKSKRIYFLHWSPESQFDFVQKSLEDLISQAMQKAHDDNYRSIAFPAIGCGHYKYPLQLVAQTMVNKSHQEQILHKISVGFIINETKKDVFNEFDKQINLLNQSSSNNFVSRIIQNGLIQIEKGDITKQKVDVIVVSSSSDFLRQIIIIEGGAEVYESYEKESKNNPNALLICTPPGNLSCKKIFFLKWKPDSNENVLRQSIIDFIWNVIQNSVSNQFESIAFPSIGCGHENISSEIIIETMINELINQIRNRNLSLTIKFIILPDEHSIYQQFCQQLLNSDQDMETTDDDKIPSTWELSAGKKVRFSIPYKSDEYKSIVDEFRRAMKGKLKNVTKIERIQNERWYFQYLAHKKDFSKRLKQDTEKRLYHGCPENVVELIVEDCFNRSFAGVNGTAYGIGVYFSTDATYSHQFAKSNSNGERCMFIARVLIGKTTLGNPSMKTRPPGFDTTTDGNHIFVTYHDAQAYAQYLIYYK